MFGGDSAIPRQLCQLLGPNGERQGTYRAIGSATPEILCHGDKIYARAGQGILVEIDSIHSALAALVTPRGQA